MHQPAPTVTRHDFIETTARDGRVLVVVFLRGGADGLTLVPPVADPMYRTARPTLAVRAKDAIDLNGYFAVHRDLDALMPYIERQELAIVHGAGSDDTTRSHFEAQDTMEHGGVQTGSGWLGRFLRAQGPVASALSAVAIGTTRPESLRGAPAGAVMQTVREFSVGGDDDAVMEQLARLYAAFGGPVGAAGRDTIDAVRRLRALRAEGGAAESSTPYPPGTFGRGLREIAKLIKADVGLTTTTIDLDGWDTHFVQGRVIGGLMEQLGAGIDAFMTDLGSRRDGVTVVVLTEFGRRLRENSSFGTDHG
ncbi:MAG: DUF1501 domain-containing protein, partial [Phycisphaerales bacterium]|nr:DUF1501 domain-containing protein [Phycisphaerales bacterium]